MYLISIYPILRLKFEIYKSWKMKFYISCSIAFHILYANKMTVWRSAWWMTTRFKLHFNGWPYTLFDFRQARMWYLLTVLYYKYKQRVLMHGHQGWNVRHGLCHIYMIYVYIWVVYSFCLFCCLFIIVTTQFVALYKPRKPKLKPSTYDPPDNHLLAEIQRPILRPEPKQQICHQHANTDHFGK